MIVIPVLLLVSFSSKSSGQANQWSNIESLGSNVETVTGWSEVAPTPTVDPNTSTPGSTISSQSHTEPTIKRKQHNMRGAGFSASGKQTSLSLDKSNTPTFNYVETRNNPVEATNTKLEKPANEIPAVPVLYKPVNVDVLDSNSMNTPIVIPDTQIIELNPNSPHAMRISKENQSRLSKQPSMSAGIEIPMRNMESNTAYFRASSSGSRVDSNVKTDYKNNIIIMEPVPKENIVAAHDKPYSAKLSGFKEPKRTDQTDASKPELVNVRQEYLIDVKRISNEVPQIPRTPKESILTPTVHNNPQVVEIPIDGTMKSEVGIATTLNTEKSFASQAVSSKTNEPLKGSAFEEPETGKIVKTNIAANVQGRENSGTLADSSIVDSNKPSGSDNKPKIAKDVPTFTYKLATTVSQTNSIKGNSVENKGITEAVATGGETDSTSTGTSSKNNGFTKTTSSASTGTSEMNSKTAFELPIEGPVKDAKLVNDAKESSKTSETHLAYPSETNETISVHQSTSGTVLEEPNEDTTLVKDVIHQSKTSETINVPKSSGLVLEEPSKDTTVVNEVVVQSKTPETISVPQSSGIVLEEPYKDTTLVKDVIHQSKTSEAISVPQSSGTVLEEPSKDTTVVNDVIDQSKISEKISVPQSSGIVLEEPSKDTTVVNDVIDQSKISETISVPKFSGAVLEEPNKDKTIVNDVIKQPIDEQRLIDKVVRGAPTENVGVNDVMEQLTTLQGSATTKISSDNNVESPAAEKSTLSDATSFTESRTETGSNLVLPDQSKEKATVVSGKSRELIDLKINTIAKTNDGRNMNKKEIADKNSINIGPIEQAHNNNEPGGLSIPMPLEDLHASVVQSVAREGPIDQNIAQEVVVQNTELPVQRTNEHANTNVITDPVDITLPVDGTSVHLEEKLSEKSPSNDKISVNEGASLNEHVPIAIHDKAATNIVAVLNSTTATNSEVVLDSKTATNIGAVLDSKPEANTEAVLDSKTATNIGAVVESKVATTDVVLDSKASTNNVAVLSSNKPAETHEVFESKAETNTEAVVDSTAATNTEAVLDNKTATTTKAVFDSRTAINTEVDLDSKAPINTEAVLYNKAATQDAVLDSKVPTNTETFSDSKTATKTEGVLDSSVATNAEAVLDSKAVTTDAIVDSKASTNTETVLDSNAAANTEAVLESKVATTDAVFDSNAPINTGAGLDSKAVTTDAIVDSKASTNTETVLDSNAAANTEAVLDSKVATTDAVFDSNAATTAAVIDRNAATKADVVLDSNAATNTEAVLDVNAAIKTESVFDSKAISIDQATVDSKDKSFLQTDSSNLNDQTTQSEPLRSLDISANNEVSMSNNQAQSALQNLQTMDATVPESKLTKSPNVEAIIIPATFYEDKVDILNQQIADADVIRTNALDKSESSFVNNLGQSVESKTVDSGKSDLHGDSKGELSDTLALSQVAEKQFTDKSGPLKSYETKTLQTSDQLAGKEGVVVYMPRQTQAATGTVLDQQDTSILIKEVPVVQYEATDAISTVLETSTLVDGIIPFTTEKDISDKSYTQTTKLESTILMETTEGKQTISDQSTSLKISDKLVKPVPKKMIKDTTDGAQSILQTKFSEELLQQQPLVEGSPSINQTMTSKDVDGVVVKEYSSKAVEGQTDLVFSATPDKVDIIPVSHETNTVKKIDETPQYELKGLANTEKYDLTFETAKKTDTTEPMVKTTLSPFFASESPSVPIMDEQNTKTESIKIADTTEPVVKTTLSPFIASEAPSVPIIDEQSLKTESAIIVDTTEPVLKTTLSPFIASEAPSVPIIDEQSLKTESAIIVDTTEPVLKTTLSPFIASESSSVPIMDEQNIKTESVKIADTTESVVKTTLSPFIASEAPSVPIIDEQSLKTESAIIVDTTEPVLKTTLSPFIASEAPSVPITDEQSLKTESAIIIKTTLSPFIASEAPSVPITDEQSLKTESAIIIKTTLSPFIASEAPSVPIIDEQSLKTESAIIIKTTLSPFIASEAPSVPIIDEQSLKIESGKLAPETRLVEQKKEVVDSTATQQKQINTVSQTKGSEKANIKHVDQTLENPDLSIQGKATEQKITITDQAVVVKDTIQTKKTDKLPTETKILLQTLERTGKPATEVTQKTAMPKRYLAETGPEKSQQQLGLETTNVRATESKPVKESRVAWRKNEPINELSRDLYHRSMQIHKKADHMSNKFDISKGAEATFGVNKDRKQNLVQQYEPEMTSPALETLCGNSMFIDGIGYAEYPGYCDKLVQCYTYQRRTTAVQRECPYGYFWHQDQVLCRPPAEVPCYDDPCLDIDMVQYNRTGGCRSYYRCDYGISVPQCCEKGFRYDSYGCVPDPTCRDPCMTPYDLENRMRFQSCKFLPDEYNPYGYLTMEHNGLRIRACPEGTVFSARQCGCRSGNRRSGRRRMKECQPNFYMNFNYGFKELSGSNMAFDVHNVVINDGAAQFNGNGRITLWGFMNKELGKKFAIRIRFKPDPKATGKGNLISNCGMTGTATVAIGLENHKVKLVAKSNSFSRRTIINSHFDPYSWNDVTYVYDGNSFVAAIDGYRSRKPLGGLLETRSNAIVIGGCPKPGSGYKGLIDSIEVFSGCIPRNIYKPRKQR
ncbi:serine-rich adhesin for platelets-like [Mytilus californianus]|uniref:serine-rich adhesin for platelets-like n=1 Tax=Mytilus californianus TaxID=6549 RepID=UPI00224504A2|nr:serine-rich adhesin for platelets-like [Mytilus californianus]